MNALWQDVRYALRSLGRQPTFALVVIASLGLGIGANTTIFSLANVLLLRPLPAQHPEELVSIYTSESDGRPWGTTSYPDYVDLRDRARSFAALSAEAPMPISLTRGDHSERVLGTMVSGNYFPLLGARPALGRALQPEDDRAGAPAVAYMSHALWTRRFGSDPSIVGEPVTLNGHAFTLVGVAPPSFRGTMMGLTPDVWVPIATCAWSNPAAKQDLASRGGRWLMLKGRLKPGASQAQARAELQVLARQLAVENAVADSGRTLSLLPESQSRIMPSIRGPVTAFVALLLGVVALVLLVACANVAGLLLARGASRRREIAVRLALGASRGRIVRQLLTETTVLSLIGGAVGLLLAVWGADLLMAFQPPLPLTVSLDLRPDGRVLAFTTMVAIGVGLLFGLAPALEATRPNVAPALSEGAGTVTRRSRLRSVLVTAQVAVSLLLLIGAGLLLRSLGRAQSIDPGFDVDRVLAMSFDLQLHGDDEATGRATYTSLLERVSQVPGVSAAALDAYVPLGLDSRSSGISIEGYDPGAGAHEEYGNDTVSEDYFTTMGMPIVSGRAFRSADRAGAAPVVIVDPAFARRFWKGQDAIGKHIGGLGADAPAEVVGVVRDARYRSLGEAPRPFFYIPFGQNYQPGMTLVVRTERNPRALLPVIRGAVQALDPTLSVFEVRTLAEHLGIALLPIRLASSVLGSFGLLALLLAAIGLYGVVAFSVAQRTREIGVRVALGATPGDVLRLVVVQGMRLAGIGMGLGLGLALLATRFVASLLFGMSPTDPVTFVAIVAGLGLVALVASWIPARRAARLDPVVALRQD